MSTRKTALGILGSLIALFAIGLLVAGGAVVWATGSHRAADGFITSSTTEVSTESYALTSTHLDLGAVRNDWFPASWLATIQVTASSRGDAPLFIGIGSSDDVAEYLEDVAHDEITRISNGDVTYLRHEGAGVPTVPLEQAFWVASSQGPGPQNLVWDIEPGQWTVLIMNSDATPDVAVAASAGARTPWLAVAIVILFLGGLFGAAVGALILLLAFKRPATVTADGLTPVAQPMATVPMRSEHDSD